MKGGILFEQYERITVSYTDDYKKEHQICFNIKTIINEGAFNSTSQFEIKTEILK